jgi:cell division septation protein DedD
MIIIAGSVLVAAALLAAVIWGVTRGGSRQAPLIEADARPIKVRPDNPGGLRVPNQDELIFDRNRGPRSQAAGGLAPEAENPRVDQLRAQLAERAAQEAARNAAPAAAAPAIPPPAAPSTALPPTSNSPAPPANAPRSAAPATNSALTAPSLPAPVPQSAERFAPVANGRVQVQLGALPTETAARAEWERLQKRMPELLGNRRLTVTPFEREGQTPLYRIRSGGFADAPTARAFCEEMRGRSVPCMVIGS